MSDIDLTALDRPLGEYPDAVIGALARANWRLDGVDVCINGAWWPNNGDRLKGGLVYRLAPEPPRPMSPPWDVLPEWADAVAMDEKGGVYVYDAVPDCGKDTWHNKGNLCLSITYLRFDRGNLPWRESLVLRPEGV